MKRKRQWVILFFLYITIVLLYLEDNYFTILWWFLLYNNMNWPQVYMFPPCWAPLSPPSPPYPSGLSQSTGFGCPASCIKIALVIYFTNGNIHISMSFSQIILKLQHKMYNRKLEDPLKIHGVQLEKYLGLKKVFKQKYIT